METRLTEDFSIIWFARQFPILPRVLGLPGTPMKHSWFWATSLWKPSDSSLPRLQEQKLEAQVMPFRQFGHAFCPSVPKPFCIPSSLSSSCCAKKLGYGGRFGVHARAQKTWQKTAKRTRIAWGCFFPDQLLPLSDAKESVGDASEFLAHQLEQVKPCPRKQQGVYASWRIISGDKQQESYISWINVGESL
jgi:hypothetical protein